MTNTFLAKFDRAVINVCSSCNSWFGRFALFIVYFWFGILKLVAESPANPLVDSLLARTLPFLTFEQFNVMLGTYEVLIGILFLFPKATRLVVTMLAVHMVTTFMPLVLLPAMTWQSFGVPTLEGQYIIKNVLIIALAIGIVAHLHPLRSDEREAA